jgi:hypothetical protein
MSQSRARLGRIAAAAVKSVSVLAVGACVAAAVGTGVAHAATPPDPLKNWSVAHIEATALANAERAPSLTMYGSFADGSQTDMMSLAIKRGVGCTVTYNWGKEGKQKILVIGNTVYLYLDKTFWTYFGGSGGAAVYNELKGRWMKVASASMRKTLIPLCTPQNEVSSGSGKITVTRGKVSTLDGVRVLQLKGSDGSDLYVTDSSRPEIFALTSPKGSREGAEYFRVNVGARVTLAAPPASDVVSGAPYGF